MTLKKAGGDVITATTKAGGDLLTTVVTAGGDTITTLTKAGGDTITTVKKAGDDTIVTTEKAAKDTLTTVSKGAGDIYATLQKANGDTFNTIKKAGSDTTETIWKAGDDTIKTTRKAAGDTVTTIQIAGGDVITTVKKANGDIVATLTKAGGDVIATYVKAGQDTLAESGRAAENIVIAGGTLVRYVGREAEGTVKSVQDAGERVREGKFVDAMWHLSTDSFRNTEANAAKATQESSLVRAVAQVAASTYGGPAGAAAFAAWYTYRATGDAEMALKVGIITGATSLAYSSAANIPSTVQRAAVTGAIGGLSVAASGGDRNSITQAFLLSGAMVVVQDGYKEFTGRKLTGESSSNQEPFCMAEEYKSCSPPDEAYLKDAKGNRIYEADGKTPKIDVTKTDAPGAPMRSHVGMWSKEAVSPLDPTGERGVFMQAVSKAPGMNGMSLFHDKWCVTYNYGTVATVASIIPATAITYVGLGAPSYDKIQSTYIDKHGRKVASPSPSVKPVVPTGVLTAQPSPPAPAPPSASTKAETVTIGSASKTSKAPEAQVLSSFYCSHGAVTKAMDAISKPPKEGGRICEVVMTNNNGKFIPWNAHHEQDFCTKKAYSMASYFDRTGYACYAM